MQNLAFPLIFALLFWWFSTGIILWLMGRPRSTYKWTALGASIILGVATAMVLALRNETTVTSAYAGFTAGVLLWAWHEIMFLLGFISGPRKQPCPPNLSTWQRFVVSSETIAHHEIAIAVHAAIIFAMSWGAINQVAMWTFFLLWGMRISAKLIVFFGAPNISDTFLPEHLSYLKSYFKKSAAGVAFLIAITIVTSATAAIAYQASIAPFGSFQSIGLVLVAGLGVLAVFEHWALVLPVPDAALWNWAIRRPRTTIKPTTSDWRKS